jgi:hypothetical protein
MKAMLDEQAVNAYIELHKQMKLPFTLSISNYTQKIESDYCNITFLKTEQSKRVFAAFAKIKSDIKGKPIPKITNDDVIYFQSNFLNKDFHADIIHNIDLKSAYATVLLNDNIISKKTFDYLATLKKQERLAAVGMLAGRKSIYTMDETGEPIDRTEKISETSGFFFHCVKRTGELMKEAAKHLGEAFIFTWVDGIYFLQDEEASRNAAKIIQAYFKENKYKTTFEVLTDFTVELKQDYYQCRYIKDGKRKIINVPKPENKIAKKITEYLLKKKY